jgi:hypothetical protein
MRKIWFMHHVGHGGGGWLQLCCNQHPAGISVVAECHLDNCLDLLGRGLTMANYDDELCRLMVDREEFGDACFGIIKSFRGAQVNLAQRLVGPENTTVCWMIRNPRMRWCEARRKKEAPGAQWFTQLYRREPRDIKEIRLGTARYFKENYFGKALAGDVPIIRLEDLNTSMRLQTGFFQRLMEHLCGVEWSNEYMDHIRENWLPSYQYHNWLEWTDGRVTAVVTEQRDKPTWILRHNWDDDPYPKIYWNDQENMEDWEREIYLEQFGELEQRLGYNLDEECTVHDDWVMRGAYPWGDVYD